MVKIGHQHVAGSEKLLDEPSMGRVRPLEGLANRHCLTENNGGRPSNERDLDTAL